jgi:hypothetical protein
MKQYALINIQKIKTFTELDGRSKHNLRIAYSKNVDATKSRNNINWRANPKLSIKDEAKRIFEKTQQMRSSKGVKQLRSDTVKAVEIVLSASPEFFENSFWGETPERITEYFKAQINWAKHHFKGKGKLIAANLHNDESNPHLHLIFVPISLKSTNQGKVPTFSARDFVGNKTTMSEIRDSHAAFNWMYGLERGEKYFAEGKEPKPYTKSIAAKRNLKDREDEFKQPKDEVDNQNEIQNEFQQSLNKTAENLANKLGGPQESKTKRKRGLKL